MEMWEERMNSEKNKRLRQVIYRIMAAIFLAVILGLAAANILKKDDSFSENENRTLEPRPKSSVTAILDGSFMKHYETYQADQFVGRDLWVELKTNLDLLLGKREEKGVFLGKNHYLMEEIESDAGENVEDNKRAIKEFAEANTQRAIYFLLAPNAAGVWEDRLPPFAVTENQAVQLESFSKALPEGIQWIDALEILKAHEEEEIYYHTDHHWTSLGAYYVFQGMKEAMQMEDAYTVPVKPWAVTNTFQGTLSAKSGFERGYQEPIYIYLPEEGKETDLVVHDVEAGTKSASLYDSDKLKERDKYGVFLGGNSPLLDIRTASASEKKLLIFKDSYANCMIPFLVPYYRQILVADPRYYYGDVQKLLEENQISDILFLYNANTFFKDNNLAGILERA